jgi:hypothetical protein
MTTNSKPSQGENVLIILLHPKMSGGYIFRLADAYYDPTANAHSPWVTSGGNLPDSAIAGWQATSPLVAGFKT